MPPTQSLPLFPSLSTILPPLSAPLPDPKPNRNPNFPFPLRPVVPAEARVVHIAQHLVNAGHRLFAAVNEVVDDDGVAQTALRRNVKTDDEGALEAAAVPRGFGEFLDQQRFQLRQEIFRAGHYVGAEDVGVRLVVTLHRRVDEDGVARLLCQVRSRYIVNGSLHQLRFLVDNLFEVRVILITAVPLPFLLVRFDPVDKLDILHVFPFKSRSRAAHVTHLIGGKRPGGCRTDVRIVQRGNGQRHQGKEHAHLGVGGIEVEEFHAG